MIWLSHKKYTLEYISGQMDEICRKKRVQTWRMVYVASAAVAIMAVSQATYLFELLGA